MTDDPYRKRRSWAMRITGKPQAAEELTVVSHCSSPPSTFSRTSTIDDAPPSRPSTPKRWSFSLTPSTSPKPYPQDPEQLERPPPSRGSSFSRRSFGSMMGLSSLSLTRTITREYSADKSNPDDDKDKEKESRGRSLLRGIRIKSASQAPDTKENDQPARTRSQSPFFFRRSRNSESSPAPQSVPLVQSDAELSDASTVNYRSTSFTDDLESETDAETDDEDKTDEICFDTVTERNTEQNAQVDPDMNGIPDVEEPDPLGEGVNVVVPQEPYFPSTLNPTESSSRGKRGAKRRKSLKHEPLPFHTSRPLFDRDRCTTTITQGDPGSKLGGRTGRRYMVASDLGEESRYALEWGIGTVLRDGDELLVVHIIENDSKGTLILTHNKPVLTCFTVDPPIPNGADRALKLRRQQEVCKSVDESRQF